MFKITASMFLFLSLAITHCVYAQIGFRLGADSADYGKDLALDKNGNIIVAGQFSGTVDFDPSASTHTLSSFGNTDNFIAKYNADGVYLWAIGFGSNGFDAPSTIDLDESGNIYICGYVSGSTDFDPGSGVAIQPSYGLKDAFVAKYDSNGQYLWAHIFGAELDDQANDIKIDKNGAISLTGAFRDTVDFDPGTGSTNLISRGGEDVFIARYNTTGDYQWAVNIGTINDDQGMAIEVDTAGYSYVSGFMWREEIIPKDSTRIITGPQTTIDIFLVKCSLSGSVLFTRRMGGNGINQTAPGGIILDAVGNVYITGGFSDTVDFNPGPGIANLVSHGKEDVFVAKYTSQGNFQTCFSFGGSEQDRASKIVVDGDGYIFISGWFKGAVDFDPGDGIFLLNSHGTNGASDIFIAKFNSVGYILWADGVGAVTSNPNDLSLAASLALDGLSNCYVTGKFYHTADFDPTSGVMNFVSAGSSDIFIIKMNSDGTLWTFLNAPIINISPKSLNIGYVFVDSIKQGAFNVYNFGDVNLVISSVSSTNQKFSVTPLSTTIIPLEAGEFTVTFAPTDSGYQIGWIILDHNGNNDKDSVMVNGWGVGYLDRSAVELSAGWNMISIPLVVGNGSKTFWFPTAKSDAFAFTVTGYLSVDTLKPGVGYWLKYDSSRTIIISGQARNEDTLNVMIGWNLIGSLTYPVSTSSIIQIPPDIIMSSFYDFSGSYGIASTLLPGRGYWVKVNQAGKLILSAP